jgi:hypothetical protein
MPNVIKFERNKSFLIAGSASGIEITATKDPAIAAALANNQPFPPGDVKLGDISVKGEAGKDIGFAGKKGSVGFKASVEAHAGLAVYFNPNELVDALDLNEKISPGLNLSSDSDFLYVLLNWGYDLAASAKGSIALGANPLTVNFSGDLKTTAAYCVIRKLGRATGAFDAVKETANSWVLPTHVETLDQIPAGTWLVAEIDGSTALSLGATFGYDFNWIRESELGGLSGEIGLRIQSGIKVALGFEASGKFALVIARESTDVANQIVRLRLFRQRKRGWSFALNVNATIQANNTLLPGELDGFLAGVFGTHGAQIVKDLEILGKWTDVNTDPSKLLAGFTLDYAKKFLSSITAIDNLDIPERLDNARKLLLKMIEKWNGLDHEVATLLMKFADKSSDLNKIRDFCEFLSKTADEDQIKATIKKLVENVDFFDLPEAKWLESATATEIAKLLNDSDEITKLKKVADKTLALLDGSEFQQVFERLQEYINTKIHLAEIEKVINEADFQHLDEWLKARLETFLGQKLDFTTFKQLQSVISKVREKAQEFYKTGLKALTDKYKFEFIATYQKSTTNSALFDLEFDFATAGVGKSLQEAVDGKFDKLMVEQRDGVKLKVATLTHEIKRNSHVEFSMPFFGKKEMDHITESIASVNATDDDGRVLAFGLTAKDVVTSKNQRNSTASLAGVFDVMPSNQVRVFSQSTLDYSYSLRQAKKAMKAADLRYQLGSYMDSDNRSTAPLLSGVFSTPVNGNLSGSIDLWYADIDKSANDVLNNGDDIFGDTLLSLQIGVGSGVTAAWMKATTDKHSPRYLDMSRRLQRKLKQLIPFIYLQNPERFKDEPHVVAGVLTYSAIPPSTQIRLDDNKLFLDQPGDVYWDHMDSKKVLAMMSHPQTATTLATRLQAVFERLNKIQGFQSVAKDYAPNADNIERILNAAAKGEPNKHLHVLLRTDSQTVNAARDVGRKLAEFKETAAIEPTKAVKLLAEFGDKFTDTFNTELSGMHGGFNARPLGTLLMIEAALALDPSLTAKDIKMTSILELIVLKDSTSFKLGDYIGGAVPKKDDCVIQQRIVSLGQ